MSKIRNMGSATMKFNEGIIVSGSAGSDVHALAVTGSAFVNGDITCNNISIGADASGTGRTISAGNTDTSLRFNASDGVDIVVGGSFFISCDENASQDTVVFNTSGHDIDFRVESNNKTHQIFSDAGNDLLVLGSDVDIPGGVGSDTNIIISGSQDGQGNVVFTGDVVVSGAMDVNTVSITSDGKVGIGTVSPSYKLEVGGNMAIGQYIYHRNDVNTFINFTDNRIRLNAGGINFIDLEKDSSAPYPLTINNGGNRINLRVQDRNSDLLLKTNSEEFWTGLYFAGDQKLVTSNVGIDVSGSILITSESATPSQPSDGQGYLYSKSDGKLYWRSYDIGETDLTAGAGGGGSGDNLSVTSPKTGNYTAGNWEFVLVNLAGASGDVTITLPAASANKQVAIKINSLAMGREVIVDGSGSETIDGLTTRIMNTDYESMHLISDGNAWWRIS